MPVKDRVAHRQDTACKFVAEMRQQAHETAGDGWVPTGNLWQNIKDSGVPVRRITAQIQMNQIEDDGTYPTIHYRTVCPAWAYTIAKCVPRGQRGGASPKARRAVLRHAVAKGQAYWGPLIAAIELHGEDRRAIGRTITAAARLIKAGKA